MNSKAPPRKAKGKGMGAPHSETGAKIIPEEERKCPYEGCDSKGHLSGNYEKHYIIEACPLYHNKTPQDCKVGFIFFLGVFIVHLNFLFLTIFCFAFRNHTLIGVKRMKKDSVL